MNIKIGDSVAVLDEVIKGVVVKIVNANYHVKATDGMLYFFEKSELVKINEHHDGLYNYSRADNEFLSQKKFVKKNKKSAFKTVKKEVVLEVDLHAEKLMKSTRGKDNYDILNVQINTAKHKIEFAIKKGISKVIFIHGVGEGVLKKELHYLLNRYPVKYSAGSYKHYGLGATEVYVFQNS